VSSRLVRGGMYVVSDVSHLECKIAILDNMLKGLLVQRPPSSQTSLVSYSNCQALCKGHTILDLHRYYPHLTVAFM